MMNRFGTIWLIWRPTGNPTSRFGWRPACAETEMDAVSARMIAVVRDFCVLSVALMVARYCTEQTPRTSSLFEFICRKCGIALKLLTSVLLIFQIAAELTEAIMSSSNRRDFMKKSAVTVGAVVAAPIVKSESVL
ncbi:MAG: twin-arginine translocation signal domain-containing protein [Phycisphaerae bacterium]|nr:twin-arginine translocation signal domain-containing protein [Phycisphaerae bacterium]